MLVICIPATAFTFMALISAWENDRFGQGWLAFGALWLWSIAWWLVCVRSQQYKLIFAVGIPVGAAMAVLLACSALVRQIYLYLEVIGMRIGALFARDNAMHRERLSWKKATVRTSGIAGDRDAHSAHVQIDIYFNPSAGRSAGIFDSR